MNRFAALVYVATLGVLFGLCGPTLAREMTLSPKVSPIVFGNRILQYYFVTAGSGDTDIGLGEDPWETGSYDLAMLQANLANFIVVTVHVGPAA